MFNTQKYQHLKSDKDLYFEIIKILEKNNSMGLNIDQICKLADKYKNDFFQNCDIDYSQKLIYFESTIESFPHEIQNVKFFNDRFNNLIKNKYVKKYLKNDIDNNQFSEKVMDLQDGIYLLNKNIEQARKLKGKG